MANEDATVKPPIPPKGSHLIDANTIHHSYNKCATLHSTSNITLSNNVCARIVGHIFADRAVADTVMGQIEGRGAAGEATISEIVDGVIHRSIHPLQGAGDDAGIGGDQWPALPIITLLRMNPTSLSIVTGSRPVVGITRAA